MAWLDFCNVNDGSVGVTGLEDLLSAVCCPSAISDPFDVFSDAMISAWCGVGDVKDGHGQTNSLPVIDGMLHSLASGH